MGGSEHMEDEQRTSESYRMNRDTSPIVDAIYRRAGEVLGIPEQVLTNERNAEPLDVLRYMDGQQYSPHYDWFVTGVPESRFVSFLMYLNTPPEGGHTSFPVGKNADGSEYVQVVAEKTKAMFFYDMLEDGNVDHYSLHAGTPVVKGPKWLATIWIWDAMQTGSVPVTKEELAMYENEAAKAEL